MRLGRLRRSIAVGASMVALVLGACTSSDGSPPRPTPEGESGGSSSASASPSAGASELAVMEFNIEYGGEQVDFDSVPKAIEAAGADLVGIEEGYGNMPRIARALGWPYYDNRTQVVSRYPLLSPDDGGPYDFVEVAPGRVVAIGNVHLPSTSYGPFQVRNGARPGQVIAIERHKRLPAVEPTLKVLAHLAARGIPVFLTGDFNAPSHLDWTPAAVGTRDNLKFAIDWPVSEAVERAGMRDSFREIHPDPVADPGLTWPANRPIVKGYNPYRNGAPADRVDFVYAGGPSTTLDSELVGEPGSDAAVEVDPWPSDHRATVSTFEIHPAPAPLIVSLDRRLVAVGEDAVVRFHAPASEAKAIVLVPPGGDPRSDALQEWPIDAATSEAGSMSLSSDELPPGAYDVVLRDGLGRSLARTALWVEAPGAAPEVRATRSRYRVGEPIRVRWRLAPGNRWDWVGIYKRDANPNVAYYKQWAYTGASIEGSVVLDRDANGPWPLPAGKYTVYLLRDDSYDEIAGGDFIVG